MFARTRYTFKNEHYEIPPGRRAPGTFLKCLKCIYNKSENSLNNLSTQSNSQNYDINEQKIDQNFSQNDVSQKEIDAISGLINLGYSQLNASQIVAKVISESKEELVVEEIIRLSLKTLITKG